MFFTLGNMAAFDMSLPEAVVSPGKTTFHHVNFCVSF